MPETTKVEHIAAFNAFATDVCEYLSKLTDTTWSVIRPADHDSPSGLVISDVIDGEARRLHFYLPMYGTGGKVHVTGEYPDNDPNRGWQGRVHLYTEVEGFKGRDRPDINVGSNRDPKHVAGDINRRMLPAYTALCTAITEVIAKDNAAADRQRLALGEMERASGGRIHGEEVSLPMNDATGYGDFRSNHDGSSWEIKLRSVPTAVAQDIARIIVENRKN